jgi:hypothetical protein
MPAMGLKMGMRKTNVFLLYCVMNILVLGLLVGHAFLGQKRDVQALTEKRRMVREHRLTDLCLFTEASYTRHPGVSDRHTPFQDGPMVLEHFPSGSIVPAPGRIKR